MLGSITETLTLTWEYVYANDLKVRLVALTDLTKDQCLGGPGLIMGGINFGWLAVRVRAQGGSVATWRYVTFVRCLGEPAMPGGVGRGNAGHASTLHQIPWHLPYNGGKSQINLSQGN